ncbi:hypothetical protein C8R11_11066 [Nitrosomonas aestuarii]|nr:hypothetical protein C8R11_11066 [Nitrosomonas aestuarii]
MVSPELFIAIILLCRYKQGAFIRNGNSLKSEETIEESSHLAVPQRLLRLQQFR